jgi:hypothetical protein
MKVWQQLKKEADTQVAISRISGDLKERSQAAS